MVRQARHPARLPTMPKSPKFIRLQRINSKAIKTAYAVIEMAYATAKTWNFLDKPGPTK
jgi:hypothetical protein